MGWRRGYAPDCKSRQNLKETNHLALSSYQDIAGTHREPDNHPPDPKNEAPEALAGATGANVQGSLEQAEDTPKGSVAATALSRAIYNIPREVRVPILELMLGTFEPGWPLVPFGSHLADARAWAAWASLPQREALTLACFETLPAARQAAFLAHVAPERRAAA